MSFRIRYGTSLRNIVHTGDETLGNATMDQWAKRDRPAADSLYGVPEIWELGRQTVLGILQTGHALLLSRTVATRRAAVVFCTWDVDTADGHNFGMHARSELQHSFRPV
jgi:hypothetical protein